MARRERRAFWPAAADGSWIMLNLPQPGRYFSVRANHANPDDDGYGERVQYFDYTLDIVDQAICQGLGRCDCESWSRLVSAGAIRASLGPLAGIAAVSGMSLMHPA